MLANARWTSLGARHGPIWLSFGFVFGIGAIGVWVATPASWISTKTLPSGQDLVIELAGLPVDVPKFFAYGSGPNDKIEFFVEREAGDKITIVFSSCRKCFRSGYYRQDSQILCGRCKQPMERLANGQTPTLATDCTQIPIPIERFGNRAVIRARAVGDAFDRWYRPALAEEPPLGNQNRGALCPYRSH